MVKNLIVKINVKKQTYNYNNPLNKSNIKNSSGTGFFIANNYILTCYHVIEDAVKIYVNHEKTNKEKLKVVIHSLYPDDDLAVLYIDNLKYGIEIPIEIPIMILKNKLIDDDNSVTVYGYPLNSNTLKITKGTLSGYHKSFFETDATLNPGNSGGPLIYKNKIIGINASKLASEKVDNVGYVIPIKRFLLYKKMKNITKGTKLFEKPTLGIDFHIIDKNNIKNFNLELDHGIRIINITNKIDGIEIGDFMLEFNKMKIDIFGDIKINEFPEKINIDDITRWCYIGQKVTIKIFSMRTKEIKAIDITLINNNLFPSYYKNYSKDFWIKKGNITFSQITEGHVQKLPKLNLELESKVFLMNSIYKKIKKKLFYISYQEPSEDSITIPIGYFVKKLNNINIESIEDIEKIENIESIEFLNGKLYYLNIKN